MHCFSLGTDLVELYFAWFYALKFQIRNQFIILYPTLNIHRAIYQSKQLIHFLTQLRIWEVLGFRSRPGDWLSWHIFCGSPQSLQANAGIAPYIRSRQDCTTINLKALSIHSVYYHNLYCWNKKSEFWKFLWILFYYLHLLLGWNSW
jgi:hypothetical protein